MKTVEKIKKEILEIENEYSTQRRLGGDITDRELKSAGTKCAFLRKCQYYLESVNPSKELIEKDINLAKREIEIIEKGFQTWFDNNPEAVGLKNPQSKYFSENNLTQKKSQLKTLQYLIND